MWRKLVIVLPTLAFAFGVLFVSIFRTAAVKYELDETFTTPQVLGEEDINIDYQLPFPGRVLPDSPLWPLKALRDKLWLLATTSPSRKAELKLLFADKRLGSSKILFGRGKAEEGLSTLTKAEKYLEEAGLQEAQNRQKGIDTQEFLQRLARASLKHYEIMQEMLKIAPEEAKPVVIESQSYAKRAYENSRNALLEKGVTPYENPFTW